MIELIKKIGRWIIDAVFPRRCVSCEVEGEVLCANCRASWAPPLPAATAERVASFYYADPIVRNLICDWKFSYDRACRDQLFRVLKNRLGSVKQLVRSQKIEAVCCVPLHPVKKRLRGFDQAEEIALLVARKTQRVYLPLLLRHKTTTAQAGKSEVERRLIVEANPFIINPALVVPKRLLLVDDVWTTGSTVAAAAAVLKEAGVEQVLVYTVAQG